MMLVEILISLVAGLASAMMFASLASGAMISLALFYLAPLPLMVVALGWGSRTGLIGGIAAVIGLGVFISPIYMLAYAGMVALPALWLGHLALLARASDDADAPNGYTPSTTLDWYPVGRLLVWTAGFAALTTTGALLTLGTDEATIKAVMRQSLTHVSDLANQGGLPPNPTRDAVIDALVSIAPAAAALVAMLTLTVNLWLAAKIARTSQLLKRPWPDLRTTELPQPVLAALAIALILCFFGGLTSLVAKIVSAALLLAYGMTGFAVLHTVSQSMAGRSFMLGGLYALTLFIGWPLLGAIVLGLADAAFGIRRRYWRKQGGLPDAQ
ncbi:putative membrane protein [Afipia carboxidovorans OM5]|uniref:Transmembrane protein n=1 Tax=Afipia carboxidovorans (strain ATCC 49405 / DSM 1227 / KCTC 32145 / OM5) TaxID=504832 RepID=B6JGW5_AFIC5|nr:DUF2232 domain-containing protein [Afipia carboxidovorans]ACI93486.1 putative membrane protein [Afipia carboxidovorans OM5]AEI02809.1 hypothetical protein OCA4_c16710 [Afipia carboxidovorans OM4]AEI06385.1 hypothetical protein OCA5_c16710 [Afipia carboxidovorans OM5]